VAQCSQLVVSNALSKTQIEQAMAMATHIDSARLRQVVTDKLDLKMDELRHLMICEECLDALAKLRSENRKTKPKARKKSNSN
jgi:malate/lactate dehydrogenase